MGIFNGIRRVLDIIGSTVSNLLLSGGPFAFIGKIIIVFVGYLLIGNTLSSIFIGTNSTIGTWFKIPYHVILASLLLSILIMLYIVELQRTIRTNGFFSIPSTPILIYAIACYYIGPISLFTAFFIFFVQVVLPFIINKKNKKTIEEIEAKNSKNNNFNNYIKDGEIRMMDAKE